MIAGLWTYRSYLNDPAEVGGDAEKALAAGVTAAFIAVRRP